MMDTTSINIRYSSLASDSCCLSCGGAVNFARPQQGECCIDLGSGRGTDVLRMAETVGVTGMVYGVDISDGMIETAIRHSKKLGITNVSFIRSDLENISLPDGIANLIISNCTINHATDKQKVWNEIYRLLKPGGRFVVSDIYSLEQVPEEYRKDPAAVSECWAGAVTREEYMNTLIQTGFSQISVLEESKPYHKGLIDVASFTIFGKKAQKCCCCG